jgi:hypothetical protein
MTGPRLVPPKRNTYAKAPKAWRFADEGPETASSGKPGQSVVPGCPSCGRPTRIDPARGLDCRRCDAGHRCRVKVRGNPIKGRMEWEVIACS